MPLHRGYDNQHPLLSEIMSGMDALVDMLTENSTIIDVKEVLCKLNISEGVQSVFEGIFLSLFVTNTVGKFTMVVDYIKPL